MLLISILLLATSVHGKHKRLEAVQLGQAKTVVPISVVSSTKEMRPKTRNAMNPGYSKLTAVGMDGASTTYVADVHFGSDSVKLVLDTGSADIFCLTADFVCLDQSGHATPGNTTCNFGPPCRATGRTFLPNLLFQISYGDNEFLNGKPIKDSLQVGGLSSNDQVLNLVNSGHWNGDGITSGVLGLGIGGTNIYTPKGSSGDLIYANYPSLIEKALQDKNMVGELFSIAVTRNSPNEIYTGSLAFGGKPENVATYGPTACVSMVDANGAATKKPTSYQIKIDKITIGGKIAKGSKDSVALVDSGTSLILAPKSVSDHVRQGWDPTDLAQMPPSFVITIGGVDFKIRNDDMRTTGAGVPMSSVCALPEDWKDQPFLLGDTFLRNVLAVFDVGKSRMMFASTNEEQYPNTPKETEVHARCPR